MTLRIDFKREGRIAGKARTCWKILERSSDKTLHTPVMNTEVREEDGFVMLPLHEPEIRYEWTRLYAYGGVIHACDDTFEGVEYASRNVNMPGLAIARCVIPKGARYWRGEDGQVCADRMVFSKVVFECTTETMSDPVLYGWKQEQFARLSRKKGGSKCA